MIRLGDRRFLSLPTITGGQVWVAGATAALHRIDRPAKFLAGGLDEILTANRLRLPPTGNCRVSEGHSLINTRANVRMSPRSCRTTTSCCGPATDLRFGMVGSGLMLTHPDEVLASVRQGSC
jgi:hypothetical protein